MALRIASFEDFKKIAEAQKETPNDFELSEQDLEFLYQKGVDEMNNLEQKTLEFVQAISSSVLGHEILSNKIVEQCLEGISYLVGNELPAILSGEYDKIEVDEQLDEDSLDKTRIQMYQRLHKKYIRRD